MIDQSTQIASKILSFFILLIALQSQFFSPVQAQNFHSRENDENSSHWGKSALVTVARVVMGVGLGAGFGQIMPESRGYLPELENGFKYALIGAVVVPVFFYDYSLFKKKKKYPLRYWYPVFGVNRTFTNHKATQSQSSFVAGIGRSYQRKSGSCWQLEMLFSRRLFLLPPQVIYAQPLGAYNYRWESSVVFSVNYIDMLFMKKILIPHLNLGKYHFTIGGALMVPVSDKTSYDIHRREELGFGWGPLPVVGDFYYNDAETSGIMPYLGAIIGLEYENSYLAARLNMNIALFKSNQMYALNDKTRLHTISISFGYKLPNLARILRD
ncbi:MAG: hypothetical protein DWQ05_02710 [Calditrichaeota bacterium]|nr:MAG: hypothetical protein DWQ05_02710 [Calditrichota bacterium]